MPDSLPAKFKQKKYTMKNAIYFTLFLVLINSCVVVNTTREIPISEQNESQKETDKIPMQYNSASSDQRLTQQFPQGWRGEFISDMYFINQNGAGDYNVIVSSPSTPKLTQYEQTLDSVRILHYSENDQIQGINVSENGVGIFTSDDSPAYYETTIPDFSGNEIPSADWVLQQVGSTTIYNGDGTINDPVRDVTVNGLLQFNAPNGIYSNLINFSEDGFSTEYTDLGGTNYFTVNSTGTTISNTSPDGLEVDGPAYFADSAIFATVPEYTNTDTFAVVYGPDGFLRKKPLSEIGGGGSGGNRPDSTFVLLSGAYYGKQITSGVYRSGNTAFGTDDTTGLVTITQPESATKNSLYFGGDQQYVYEIEKDGNATSPEIANFNFVRGFFPAVSTAGDNEVFCLGLNVSPGGGLQDVSKAGMSIRWENNYRNSVVEAKSFEFHCPDIRYPSGAFRRPITGFFSNDQTDIRGSIGFTADFLNIFDYKTFTQSVIWSVSPTDGYMDGIDFLTQQQLRFGVNNTAIFTQMNAAGTGYVRPIMVDNANRVYLGGSGESNVAAYNQFQITNSGYLWNENGVVQIGKSGTLNRLDILSPSGSAIKMIGTARTWTLEPGDQFAISDATAGTYPLFFYGAQPNFTIVVRNSSLGVGSVSGNNPLAKIHLNDTGGATAKMIRLQNTTGSNDVYRSNATPESAITGNPGDLCLTSVSSTGKLFLKRTGTGNTGWIESSPTEAGQYNADVLSWDPTNAVWDAVNGNRFGSFFFTGTATVIDGSTTEFIADTTATTSTLNLNFTPDAADFPSTGFTNVRYITNFGSGTLTVQTNQSWKFRKSTGTTSVLSIPAGEAWKLIWRYDATAANCKFYAVKLQ